MPKRKTKAKSAPPPTPLSKTLFRHGFTKENFSSQVLNTKIINSNLKTCQTAIASVKPPTVPSAKFTSTNTLAVTGSSIDLSGQINLASQFTSLATNWKPKRKRYKFIKFAEDKRPLLSSRQV